MHKGYALIGPLVLFTSWYTAGALGWLNEVYIPRLEEVTTALLTQFAGQRIWLDVGFTVYRTAAAFGLAAVFGIPLGIMLGLSAKTKASFSFLIEFFRSLPAPVIFPLFLFLFGIGDATNIMVAAFVVFWIILKNTIIGTTQASIIRQQVAQIFHSSRLTRATVLAWDILPSIMAGLKIGFSLALILIVVGEMFVGGTNGLGQKVFDSYASYRTSALYSLIIIIGFTGFFLDRLFTVAQKRLVYW